MAEAPEPKPDETVAELERAIAGLRRTREELIVERDVSRLEASRAKEAEAATRAQFNDLKERLANAESVNAEMRGYLARVQEDDAVREELIAVGDPQGEQQLVPKRKPRQFFPPHSYTDLGRHDAATLAWDGQNRRPKPRHWVTY